MCLPYSFLYNYIHFECNIETFLSFETCFYVRSVKMNWGWLLRKYSGSCNVITFRSLFRTQQTLLITDIKETWTFPSVQAVSVQHTNVCVLMQLLHAAFLMYLGIHNQSTSYEFMLSIVRYVQFKTSAFGYTPRRVLRFVQRFGRYYSYHLQSEYGLIVRFWSHVYGRERLGHPQRSSHSLLYIRSQKRSTKTYPP